jgi:hypothetical protein
MTYLNTLAQQLLYSQTPVNFSWQIVMYIKLCNKQDVDLES